MNVHLEGTIDHFLEGKGLDLVVSGEATELSRCLHLFGYETPRLGRLTLRAKITGSPAFPALADLRLTVSDGKQLEVTVTGSTANLLKGSGTHLAFSVACSHDDLIRLVMPESSLPVTDLTARGTIREVQEDFLLHIAEAHVATAKSISFSTHDGTLHLDKHLAFQEINLKLSLTAPDTGAIKPFLFDFLPPSGPVTAQAELRVSNNMLAVEQLLVKGKSGADGVAIDLNGRIGSIPLDGGPITDIDLRVSLAAATSTPIASAFNLPVPELGATTVHTRAHGSIKEIFLDDFSLVAQHPRGLSTKAAGALRFGRRTPTDSPVHLDLETEFLAPTATALAPMLDDKEVPFPAPLEARSRVIGTTEKLSLKNIVVTMGEPGEISIDLRGNVGTISLTGNNVIDEIDLHATLDATAGALSNLLGRSIPDIGHLTGTSHLISRNGLLYLDDVTLRAPGNKGFAVQATGTLGALSLDRKVLFSEMSAVISTSGKNAAVLTSLFGIPVPDAGSFEGGSRFHLSRPAHGNSFANLQHHGEHSANFFAESHRKNGSAPQSLHPLSHLHDEHETLGNTVS